MQSSYLVLKPSEVRLQPRMAQQRVAKTVSILQGVSDSRRSAFVTRAPANSTGVSWKDVSTCRTTRSFEFCVAPRRPPEAAFLRVVCRHLVTQSTRNESKNTFCVTGNSFGAARREGYFEETKPKRAQILRITQRIGESLYVDVSWCMGLHVCICACLWS